MLFKQLVLTEFSFLLFKCANQHGDGLFMFYQDVRSRYSIELKVKWVWLTVRGWGTLQSSATSSSTLRDTTVLTGKYW